MPTPSAHLHLPLLRSGPAPLPFPVPAPAARSRSSELAALPARRDRVWDLSPNLHCSVVGTCLTTAELRQLFAKLNDPDARTASDHTLHGRAVRAAGQKDVAGKLLNKLLDKRHEVPVKRFAKARTTAEVRALWREALERGDIPGAYWAVLTHPATDQGLVQEVFGEVHMLSHLVGMSNRADIARLRHLEQELGGRDEKIARQEARLQQMAAEREALARRVEELEHTRRQAAAQIPAPQVPDDDDPAPVLKRRLADEQARSAVLAERLAAQDQVIARQDDKMLRLKEDVAALGSELASLEAALAGPAEDASETADGAPDLQGRRLLYVGGRPKQVEQLRALARRFGGELLSHDGGIEDNVALLPGLVSQSDIAFFPVDCVSHHAAGQVKRLCRETDKPFLPLRSASLASFVAAIGRLDGAPAAP
ncbi:MAG TPA: DUF2325 domain-containing protein [Inquilinus sp.]|nr:DUF2325 domain-containing protein [Inquilinus sp.]